MEKELANIFPHFTHIVERIATPSWQIKEEAARMYNLILIYDGQAEFFCSGHTYRGAKGDLIFYRPGELRRAHTFPDQLLKCFAVDFLYTYPVWLDGEWRLHRAELPFATIQRIQDAFLFSRLLDLFRELTKAWLGGTRQRIGRCRAVFGEIMELLLLERGREGFDYAKIRRVERVIQYLTEHYAGPVTLEKLSRAARISPSYLGSIFREITGKTPMEYLTAIRINKAQELMRDGYTVTETALQVGFHDVFYFSKCFKKNTGVAPSQFPKLRPSEEAAFPPEQGREV